MSIDWATLQQQAAAAFDVVPKGEYPFTVTGAEATEAKSTGKPMIKCKFRIDGGAHNGRVVFNNFVVSAENPTAMGFFFRNMKVFGLGPEYFAQQPSLQHIAEAILGRTGTMTVGVRQYQGQDQNEVKTIKPLAPLAPMVGGAPSPGVPVPGVPAPVASPVASPVPPAQPMPPVAPTAPVAAPAAPVAAPVAPPQVPVAGVPAPVEPF